MREDFKLCWNVCLNFQLLRQPTSLILLLSPLPRHRAEDAQGVVHLPAHAAQGVCRQLGECHAEGEHNRCRGKHKHCCADHRAVKEDSRLSSYTWFSIQVKCILVM